MSYNVDTIDVVAGELTITKMNLMRAQSAVPQEDRPEVCWLDETEVDWRSYRTPVRLTWEGEGSGPTWLAFKRSLLFTSGQADLVVCWEGGDSYTGLRVNNGLVTEHEVIHTLGKEK